jgi:hypothetical protein
MRLRVMAIIDRLLDPAVIEVKNSPLFTGIYRWLCQLEENVHPVERCAFDILALFLMT